MPNNSQQNRSNALERLSQMDEEPKSEKRQLSAPYITTSEKATMRTFYCLFAAGALMLPAIVLLETFNHEDHHPAQLPPSTPHIVPVHPSLP